MAARNLLLRLAEIVYKQTSPDGAKAKDPSRTRPAEFPCACLRNKTPLSESE